jgi:hypothetical protein
MRHAVDGFVDGAVAAGDQDEIRAAIDSATGDLTGVARAAGSDRIDGDAGGVEQLDRTRKRMLSPSECARARIINKYSLPVGLDSTLIIIDVRAPIPAHAWPVLWRGSGFE